MLCEFRHLCILWRENRRVNCKPRQLGIWNRIINDWDSKPSKFGWWFNEDSDFKVEITLWITISISLWLNSTKFDILLIKRWKKMTSMSIKRSKRWNSIEKVDLFWLFDQILSLSIYFWSLLIHFKFSIESESN